MKNLILIVAIISTSAVFAQPKQLKELPPSDIDYKGFAELTNGAESHRKTHMVSLDKFIELSKQRGVLILDTRSKAAFDKKHVKGAVHLNFSDFTQGKLAKVIPSKNTKVLIYCNNNIDKDEMYFARKMRPLALNIPTFINLFGYGYKNVYELNALVPTIGTALKFEGEAVKKVK